MSELLLVTGVLEPSAEVLPALGLLLHSVRVLPADASALVEAPPADVVLVDAAPAGRAARESIVLDDGCVIEVLPPFAGG